MVTARKRTGIGDGVQRELHWEVCAVLASGNGNGRCGHHHATADEATACNWAPPDWDDHEVCDLLVRQIRTEKPEQAGKARRRA